MTLIKSLLLGSAAGIFAVASAQAADLPTRKGAPAVEYVKVCKIVVAGKPVIGFTLPGSDTCLHLYGYITGQIEGGNTEKGYSYGPGEAPYAAAVAAGTPGKQLVTNDPDSGPNGKPSFGFTTRLQFGADVVSNTAAGPLVAHFQTQFDSGSGFDTVGKGAYIDVAYVTWAGITAGKAPSFYSFTGGGPGWANFFSPDQRGFDEPDVLAYTASTGGGFSATLAIQNPYQNASGTGADSAGIYGGGYKSEQAPDIVGALALSQAWGTAQVSGVAHNVRAFGNNGQPNVDDWGFGVDAGVSFNLPSGAGDQILVTGSWTEEATLYSGLAEGLWGEEIGQSTTVIPAGLSGNGQAPGLYDLGANYNGTWQKPDAWTVTGEIDHHFNPQVSGSLVGSVGGIHWNNQIKGVAGVGSDLSNATAWLIGGVGHYTPVTNLDFEIEVFYEEINTSKPQSAVGSAWHGDTDGLAARFEVTRSW
jgi:hypothetical protein